MRIDPRRFLEFVIFLIICLWLMVIYLAGFPNAYGGYAASMLQWVQIGRASCRERVSFCL